MNTIAIIFLCLSALNLQHSELNAETFNVAFFVASESISAGIDPSLALSVAYSESRLKPLARNDSSAHDCCKGPMQVNYRYHCDGGKVDGCTAHYSEPWKGLASTGVRVLARYLERAPSEYEALRWYNCGASRARSDQSCGAGYARTVQQNRERIR